MQYDDELVDLAAAASRVVSSSSGMAERTGGSLTVVGTGIRAVGQLTVEALAAMARADVLLHVIGEPIQEAVLKAINPAAETMTDYYVDGGDRSATYEAMVQRVLSEVIAGKRTVAAFYGHPGVFTFPSHESIRRARAAGFPARMLPAVSAEDCLFADLGIDPGDGCQSYEATDLLFHNRPFDPRAHLVIWQVGTLGNWTYQATGYDLHTFPSLLRKLLGSYPPWHRATIYEAPFHPAGRPRILAQPIAQLNSVQLTPATTLHIPPVRGWGW
jgi:hypothetical protein